MLENALITVTWREVEEDHMLGASIFEHSILPDPLLAQFPDLLLGFLPINI